jgi:uncharacterized protein (DUF4415 family)
MTDTTKRAADRTPNKVAISIRLRPETLAAYRRLGRGWQTRLSDDLDRLAQAWQPVKRTR